ncbi:MAG: penicillin-binding protein [Acidobacteria bacterium]|nr:penicillin-binding protein [Acidobacteriota bacterium]
MRGPAPVERHLRRVRLRILSLAILLGIAAAVILVRLVRYQVFLAGTIRGQARQQQERVIELSPARGAIFDATGRELAVSVPVDSLFLDPSLFRDRDREVRKVARALGVGPERVQASLRRGGRRFAWVQRKLKPGTRDRIEALGIPAAGFLPEYRRLYPKKTLAAHLLGYVGVDDQGLAGLESGFNTRIRGEPGLLFAYRDARGARIPIQVDRPAREGRSLVLTVDEVIQHVVERELEAAWTATGARAATAVLIDPESGRILALANRPTFDPNRFAAFPESHLRNRGVADCFEPGSTFKVFTWAAAWQDGRIRNGERIDCRGGAIRVAGRNIHDHERFGVLTVSEVLAHSSNVGAILIGDRIGDARFHGFLTGFGFGRPTGIDLPGESPGILNPREAWSRTSMASLSMGHEVCVNPVQLTVALAAAANGGILYRPGVVEAVLGGAGDPDQRFSPAGVRVLEPATAGRMRWELRNAVETGTGQAARLRDYTVGGKTGTAQKPEPGGGYSSTRFVASFFGFAPATRPAIAALILLDEPRGKHYGGEVAAPVFARIAPEVLHYLRVAPDRHREGGRDMFARLDVAPGRGGTAAR